MTANLDTYVSSPYPTATYASATELRVGTYNGGGDKYRSYLQFPLSGSAGRTSSRGQHQGRQTRRQRGGLGRGRGGRSAVHLEGRHHLTPLRRVGRHQSGLQLLRPHDTAGQVLSSLYVNGTSTYDGTADTLVCGFQYERVAGPSLADLGRTYVTSPAGPSLADLARRSFPEQASPQDILDAEAEQGWDSQRQQHRARVAARQETDGRRPRDDSIPDRTGWTGLPSTRPRRPHAAGPAQ